jgi:hypothetical protein
VLLPITTRVTLYLSYGAQAQSIQQVNVSGLDTKVSPEMNSVANLQAYKHKNICSSAPFQAIKIGMHDKGQLDATFTCLPSPTRMVDRPRYLCKLAALRNDGP